MSIEYMESYGGSFVKALARGNNYPKFLVDLKNV